MTRMSRLQLLIASGATAFIMLVLAGGACRSPESKTDNLEASTGGGESIAPMPIHERGGAQLWGDNCARCHNSRSPSEFNDDQWDVIAHHMRVRANLTAYEHETILKFLKSAN